MAWIVAKLRQVDVLVSQGQGIVAQEPELARDLPDATPTACRSTERQSVADANRSIGVTEVNCYRWRREFGGLKTDRVRWMKELEAKNAGLRRGVAELTLDKLPLKEVASGNH